MIPEEIILSKIDHVALMVQDTQYALSAWEAEPMWRARHAAPEQMHPTLTRLEAMHARMRSLCERYARSLDKVRELARMSGGHIPDDAELRTELSESLDEYLEPEANTSTAALEMLNILRAMRGAPPVTFADLRPDSFN